MTKTTAAVRLTGERLGELRTWMKDWKQSVFTVESGTLRELLASYAHACTCGGVFQMHEPIAFRSSKPGAKKLPADQCDRCKQYRVQIPDATIHEANVKEPLLGPGDK